MQARKDRDLTVVEFWRHSSTFSPSSSSSTSWSWSLSAAWNTASASCRMMTYNLIEPEGVASLLKVNERAN